jgi:MFS family permease
MVRAESGILGPLQGWMVDRYGPRAMMRVGIALFAAGYLCFSRIDSLWGFYLSFALRRNVALLARASDRSHRANALGH